MDLSNFRNWAGDWVANLRWKERLGTAGRIIRSCWITPKEYSCLAQSASTENIYEELTNNAKASAYTCKQAANTRREPANMRKISAYMRKTPTYTCKHLTCTYKDAAYSRKLPPCNRKTPTYTCKTSVYSLIVPVSGNKFPKMLSKNAFFSPQRPETGIKCAAIVASLPTNTGYAVDPQVELTPAFMTLLTSSSAVGKLTPRSSFPTGK